MQPGGSSNVLSRQFSASGFHPIHICQNVDFPTCFKGFIDNLPLQLSNLSYFQDRLPSGRMNCRSGWFPESTFRQARACCHKLSGVVPLVDRRLIACKIVGNRLLSDSRWSDEKICACNTSGCDRTLELLNNLLMSTNRASALLPPRRGKLS